MRPLRRMRPVEPLAHEHDAGATSAHNRPLPPRVASTRTQAPVGSLLCSLVGSFAPACGSDQTGSIIFARLGAAGQRRRDGGAKPADCGGLAIAKFNAAGLEYQYGGGAWRRKSSSAAFIAAMVWAA